MEQVSIKDYWVLELQTLEGEYTVIDPLTYVRFVSEFPHWMNSTVYKLVLNSPMWAMRDYTPMIHLHEVCNLIEQNNPSLAYQTLLNVIAKVNA